MIPLIFVFKSEINVCSESKKFEFFQFQKYDYFLFLEKKTTLGRTLTVVLQENI